ncbi:MAG: hypothetical protein IGR76_01435 [Synechococcales cyanobacterium T60_A2020_003]|nr:hypothetical protein [Synechococcales cyanobacterium T60_A2020_003]
MNTQQLRKSLKHKWLEYYRDNRPWITRLRVWSNVDGVRRPSSGFILASLAALEPNLNELLPLIVDLSSDPDRIIKALELDFNPDKAISELPPTPAEPNPKLLPEATQASVSEKVFQRPAKPAIADETCQGTKPMSQPAGRDWH